MKRFSKIAMSVATVSAMAAAMAISASAMTADYAEPTGTETGKVNLTGVTATGAHQTVLVLNAVNLQEIAEGNIVQIDQKDDGTSFVSVPVGELTKGTTYEVRIGGNGTVQTATFTVGGTTPGGTTVTKVIGDADGDDWPDSLDASMILAYDSSNEAESGDVGTELGTLADGTIFVIGDADGDEWADSLDASMVLAYDSSNEAESGSVGNEVKVTVAAK